MWAYLIREGIVYDMSVQFEELVKGAVTAYGKRREQTVAARQQSDQMQKRAAARFGQIAESFIIPTFNKAAELLKQSCAVEIHRHEYTEERPFVLSVDMVIAEKPGVQNRRLRQPSPKLEICLKKRSFRVVIFTENLRDAKLQLEEMEISELDSEKIERCTYSFLAEIFR